MALREFDVVSTLAVTRGHDNREWPSGTRGTIVDLRANAATVEVLDREGYTLALLDAWMRDLQPAAA